MLKEENKIFKNLYNEQGWELENALKRDDWLDTKKIIEKGRDWIITVSYTHLTLPTICSV